MEDGVNRESSADAAESETLSMRGNSMRENRETSRAPHRLPARDDRRRHIAVRPV